MAEAGESARSVGLLRYVVFFTSVHFVFTIAAMLGSIGGGLGRFDDPDADRETGTAIVDQAAAILSQPARVVWDQFGSPDSPDWLEWLVLLGGSLCWGLVLALLRTRLWRGGDRK